MMATEAGSVLEPGRPAAGAALSRLVAPAALALALAVPPAAAQIVVDGREELAFDRPESWAMQYFSSVNLLTSLGAPRDLEAGSVELGFEAGWVPSLDEAERTVGFYGTKTEDLNKTSIFGRPRASFGLPGRVSLTLSYLPPVEVSGIEPNLAAAAIARPLLVRGNKRLGARLAVQAGTIRGDFTCSADEVAAGGDRARNPFGCEEPSRDELDLRTLTLEVSAAATMGRFDPYLSAALTSMDLAFRVGARYSGIVDTTRQSTDGSTLSVAAGAGITLTPKSRAAIELFYTPLDIRRSPRAASRTEGLFNVRALVGYRVR